MRRFAVPAVIIAAVVILLIVLAVGISGQGSNNSIAYSVASRHYKLAPDENAKLPLLGDSAKQTQSLAGYRGKVVLLNFFASWCQPCHAEAPVLAKAQKLLAAHGGTVLGVTFQNSPSDARGYMRQYGLNYPVLTDTGGHLAKAFAVTGAPDTYVIDRSGKIVSLNLYQITNGWLNKTLSKYLAPQAPQAPQA